MHQIPQELKELNQWHCWKDVNGNKIPIQVNGNAAKSNDPATWTDYQTAVDAAEFHTGLAFEIAEPYTGVDLDNCLDAFGNLREWAIPIVGRLDGVAYAEISPSGKGIKFITRGTKLPGARCTHQFEGEKQQVEVYDHARFWTVTGKTYNWQDEIKNGQAAVEWICREYLMPVEKPVRVPVPSRGFPLDSRVQNYVDGASPAGLGDRNNAAFRLAGHLWAMTGDDGERLDEDAVWQSMQVWNSRNGEPLSDAELQSVTTSASRNGTARPDKRSEMPLPATDDGVNISGIMKEFEEFKALPPTYDHLCLEIPGLIGDLIQHNLRTAFYPLPELALAGALSLMSVLTGGKVAYRGARTNLYSMGLAPSGAGKDHSRKLNRKILLHAGAPEVCGPERIGSHAGIVTAMAGNWRTLFQIDEIGMLFATMKSAGKQAPHLANISSVLMQIYSSADSIWMGDAYGDANKVKQLSYPHCVVYGTSVPDGFWESVSNDQMQNGLIGRFLVFENEEYVDYQEPEFSEIPAGIIERARAWMELETGSGNLAGIDGGSPANIDASAEAGERLKTHAMAISDRRKSESPVNAAIWSRVAEKTNKIALLFASSRWAPGTPLPSISIEDADRAIRLNNWLTRRMLAKAGEHLSGNQVEADHLKVLRMIRSKDEWSMNELTRKTRWLKTRERREILDALTLGDEITQEVVSTGGRPVTIVKAINRPEAWT